MVMMVMMVMIMTIMKMVDLMEQRHCQMAPKPIDLLELSKIQKGMGKISLPKLPGHTGLMQKWKMYVNSKVAACCGFPNEGMDWDTDCQDPDYQFDDLNDADPFATTDLF